MEVSSFHFERHNKQRTTMKVHFALPFLLLALNCVVSLQAQTEHIQCPGYPTGHTLFVENRGQWGGDARFLLRTPGLDTWITDDGMVYDLYRIKRGDRDHLRDDVSMNILNDLHTAEPSTRHGAVVRLRFEKSSSQSKSHGTLRGASLFNFFLGNDTSRWKRDVAGYYGVRLNDLYNGIDVVHYIDEGRPRYDLLVAPKADPSVVRITLEGARSVEVGPDGELRIATDMGVLEQRGLRAYQVIDGVERDVICRFVARSDGSVGFSLGSYDRSHSLVIDPLVFSTFLGGTMQESSGAIAIDSVGSSIIGGTTLSADFPTSIGAYSTTKNDIVVSKISPDGKRLLYSTYIGGGDLDYVTAIAVDRAGNTYLTGRTWSTDFATTAKALSVANSGDADVFVTKLNGGGNALIYSTYLGGTGMDWGEAIAINRGGEAVVTGLTADGFPTTPGAWMTSGNGSRDAFVAKLKSDGSGVVFSTLFGGVGGDFGYAVAIGDNGTIYIGGSATVTGFPQTVGAFAGTGDTENPNPFVAKFTPSGDALIYASLLGPAGSVRSLSTNSAGSLWVGGTTSSASFPTTPEAFDPLFNGEEDIFLMRLSPTGKDLLYATFLGGAGQEYYPAIAVDDSGQVYVTGRTPSSDFPTTSGAWDRSLSPGANDAFLTKLTADGATLLYSTYIGGADDDAGLGIALGSGGNIHLLGITSSVDFSTTAESYDTSHNGGSDFFVMLFNLNLASTPIAPDGEELRRSAGVASIEIAPNPASNRANFRFSLNGSGITSIDIFSQDGRLLAQPLPATFLEAGEHQIELDFRSLPSGGYIVRVGRVGGSVGESVVVVR